MPESPLPADTSTKATSGTSSNRQALLEKLRRVFIQRGYDGATLAHLAQATQLSKATLYHHFPGGKTAMIDQLVRLSITELQQTTFAHLAANSAPHKKLRNLLNGFTTYTENGKTGCLLAVLSHHDANLDELAPHQASIAAQFDDWRTMLVRTFEERGDKRKRAEREAANVLAQMYGALVTSRLHNDTQIFTQIMSRLRKRYGQPE